MHRRCTVLGVLLSVLLSVVASAGCLTPSEDTNPDEPDVPDHLRIHRWAVQREAPQVNETKLREQVPGFAEALEGMEAENETRASYRTNETTLQWMEFLRSDLEEPEERFNYANSTFQIFRTSQ